MNVLHRLEQMEKSIERWTLPPTLNQISSSPSTKPPPTSLRYYKTRYPEYYCEGHIELIHNELDDLKAGNALILNLPPRNGKSDSVASNLENSIGVNPKGTFLYTSYAASLAYQKSRRIRNALADGRTFKGYYPHVSLADDAKSVSFWETKQGGSFIAAGVGGSLTGMGGEVDTAVIDDPLKDRIQAESRVFRERVKDWFSSVLMSRLVPTSRLIIIQTRWHSDDLTGFILKQLEDDPNYLGFVWKQLILPGRLPPDENHPKPRALWEKFPLEWLEKKEKANPYDFASLTQQDPIPKGGILFRDTHYYKELPQSKFRKAIAIDLAYTKRTHADYVVVIRGVYANKILYLIDMQRLQSGITTTMNVLKQHQNEYGGHIHMRVGGQEGPILQLLEKEGLRIKYEKTVGDKFTNATTIVSRWNEGKIQLPENAPWIGDFLDEVLNFTGLDDEHDDIVDALITLDNVFTTKSKHGYKSGQALKSSIPAGGNN